MHIIRGLLTVGKEEFMLEGKWEKALFLTPDWLVAVMEKLGCVIKTRSLVCNEADFHPRVSASAFCIALQRCLECCMETAFTYRFKFPFWCATQLLIKFVGEQSKKISF